MFRPSHTNRKDEATSGNQAAPLTRYALTARSPISRWSRRVRIAAEIGRSPKPSVKPGKRRGRNGSWTRVILLYLVLAGAAFALVAYLNRVAHRHPYFSVSSLQIDNPHKNLSQDIRAQLRTRLVWVKGRNIFGLRLAELENQVRSHPFIKEVVLRKQLPDSIIVTVYEKNPAALVRRPDRIEVVDEAGELIAAYDDYPELPELPILSGIERSPDPAAALARGMQALEEIHKASLLFSSSLETLDLSDPENMIAHLRNEDAPIHLGGKVIPANLRNYLSIAHYLQKDYPSLAYIELGFPQQVAIKPWNQ